MTFPRIGLCIVVFLVMGLGLPAQTLYVPSGASGIGTSANGNVSIGTASAANKLQVNSTGDDGISIQSAGQSRLWVKNWLLYTPENSSYISFYNGAEQLNIMWNGNVGIGTMTPATSGGGGTPRTLEIEGIGGQIVPWGQLVLSTPNQGATNDVLGGVEFAARGASTNQRAGYIYSFKEDASATTANARLEFGVANDSGTYTAMTIRNTGNVGIGTLTPTHKLSVNGTIRAKEVIVDTGWSDYVFDADYRLAPLSEVEQHIKTEGHLPGIPSAQEVAEHGVSMGEMQSKLLAKIEELTLHVIAQEKLLNTQSVQLREQGNRLAQVEAENHRLLSR